jgi:hypothetical protein
MPDLRVATSVLGLTPIRTLHDHQFHWRLRCCVGVSLSACCLGGEDVLLSDAFYVWQECGTAMAC